jgi:hypothetical protein
LHAERQVLRTILGQIAQGTIEYHPRTAEGDRLEEYLNRATWFIGKRRHVGVQQQVIREALASYDDIVTPDEVHLILEQLGGVRRQIRAKVEAYLERSRERATRSGVTLISGNPTIVSGDMNTQITFGDGSTFHGDVIAAGIIQNSFNRVDAFDGPEELQQHLKELVATVRKLCESLDVTESQQTARNLETFTAEATSSKPQASLLKVTGDGLIEAARTVAAMAGPIAETVRAIFQLLGVSG